MDNANKKQSLFPNHGNSPFFHTIFITKLSKNSQIHHSSPLKTPTCLQLNYWTIIAIYQFIGEGCMSDWFNRYINIQQTFQKKAGEKNIKSTIVSDFTTTLQIFSNFFQYSSSNILQLINFMTFSDTIFLCSSTFQQNCP